MKNKKILHALIAEEIDIVESLYDLFIAEDMSFTTRVRHVEENKEMKRQHATMCKKHNATTEEEKAKLIPYLDLAKVEKKCKKHNMVMLHAEASIIAKRNFIFKEKLEALRGKSNEDKDFWYKHYPYGLGFGPYLDGLNSMLEALS